MENYVTGFHAVEESLKKGAGRTLFFNPRSGGRVQQLVDLARKKHVAVLPHTAPELDVLCGHGDHRGAVLLCAEESESGTVSDLNAWLRQLHTDQALVVILDEVTDPHNFGAILRSADQFGVDLVLTGKRRSASDSSVVLKTSAGASRYVSVLREVNLRRAVQALKKAGFWVYGAHMEGEAVWSLDLTGRTALVMGSEGRGLGKLLTAECDTLLSIPTQGHVDSLNVSVAAGVCLYEMARQRESRIIRSAR